MKKIKFLIASMIGAIALVFACVLGTRVNAATNTYGLYYDESTLKERTNGTDSTTLSYFSAKKGSSDAGYSDCDDSFTNIVNSSAGAVSGNHRGIKMESSTTITFNATYSCTVQIQFGFKSSASNKSDKIKLDSSESTVTADCNTVVVATFENVSSGNHTISRKSQESCVLAVLVTETYDDSVTYRTVTFYDSDKTTILDQNKSVVDGSKITAPNDPAVSNLGQEFDCWVDGEGAEFDFTNTVINANLDLYATYTIDSNYSSKVENSNKLSNGIIEYMYTNSITKTSREVKITGTIFSVGNKWDIEHKDSNTNVGTKSFNYDLKVGGKIQKDSQYIKVEAPSKGYLVAYVKNASSTNEATLSIDDYGTQTVRKSFTAIAGNATAVATIEVPAAGNYSFGVSDGNGIYLYELEFIPESVTPLVQKAVDTENGYTYVRFVTIVKGVEEISASDVSFSVTMTYTDDSSKTKEYTPYVVKKITQSGETYEATVGSATHKFDNSVNPTEYYVVYVLRFTTSSFTGCKVNATTTFGGVEYTPNNSITI